jgi:hypothetical protein
MPTKQQIALHLSRPLLDEQSSKDEKKFGNESFEIIDNQISNKKKKQFWIIHQKKHYLQL